MTVNEWRPAKFASHFRKQDPEPPIDRWEAVLRAEQTVSHQLLTALGRSTRIRRLLRIPDPDVGSGSLSEREQRVNAIRSTALAKGIEKVLGSEGRETPPDEEAGEPRTGPPPVGPLLSREIARSLALLSGMAFEEIQRRGWHLQPNHFYWPLNDLAYLRANQQVWTEVKLPMEIDWDLEGQLELANGLAEYSGELADVRNGPSARPGEFVWGEAFTGLDAYAYYGLVRHLRPSHVVEVGAGMSSNLLSRALAANGKRCEVTLIDPGPRWAVLGDLPKDWQVIPSLVQNVDPAVFARLQPGDILFYDGSHCVRTGSDVNWLFFETLPRLVPGVWIHIHDIFFPKDYWDQWIFDEGLSWNEQYFVQAFLMHNSSYRVRFGAKMLQHYERSSLEKRFPRNIDDAGSLWLEKVS